MNPNFFNHFEERVRVCDSNCNHHFVRHIYKNNTLHYELYCNIHGFRVIVPRCIATDSISNGALCIEKDDFSQLEER
jgi:hypothetical protein